MLLVNVALGKIHDQADIDGSIVAAPKGLIILYFKKMGFVFYFLGITRYMEIRIWVVDLQIMNIAFTCRISNILNIWWSMMNKFNSFINIEKIYKIINFNFKKKKTNLKNLE